MSIIAKIENRCIDENLKEISNDSYNPSQKNQNVSTKEDSFNINNNNQLFQILEPKAILDSKFYLIKKIGQGSSGKIYLGSKKESLDNKNDNMKYFSIKLMNSETIDLNAFKNEIKLLKKINHRNVLKIYAYDYGPKISLDKTKNKKQKEFHYIVMEYLMHGELNKYITDVINNVNIGFGENFGRLIFSQLLDGLEAFHNLNISHRNIKLNNIIIGENDYILKYVDFKMGIENQGLLQNFPETPNYAAPELLLRQPYYGKSDDIFSLGVTLFVLVTGIFPFKLALPNDIFYQYIAKGDYIEFWKRKSFLNLSPSFMQLFNNMIAFDFTQRPSISEIRQSNWMKEINWELLPLLKQEFIFREANIKINEYNRSIINRKKYLKNTNESNNQKINKNNKSIDNTKELIKNDCNNEINKKKEEQEKNINKSKGKLKIQTVSRNLFIHINNITRFLKKEGYIRFGEKRQTHEIDVTNGEIDIHFKLEKSEQKYIILSYYQKKGTCKSFEGFKKLLVNIKQILEKPQ